MFISLVHLKHEETRPVKVDVSEPVLKDDDHVAHSEEEGSDLKRLDGTRQRVVINMQ